MTALSAVRTSAYATVLGNARFRRFWLGFTVSSLGDAMTRVALVWYVYQATHSSQALGLLLLCYTGPVVVGGLVAGVLLDRFNRQRVMLVDNFARGVAVGMIPLLAALGLLAIWQVYAVAAVYGFFYMITLAGTPSLLPALVPTEQLPAVNALETLSYTLSGVCGPPLAGLIIAWAGAPSVLLLDVLSYAAFVLALWSIPSDPMDQDMTNADGRAPTSRMRDAVHLLLADRALLATTLMFMSFNVGEGFLAVWLPQFTTQINGGAELYGLLLGVLAAGEVGGAVLAGSSTLPLALGLRICLSQLFAGCALGLLVVGQVGVTSRLLSWALVSLLLLGLFSAPLTIWAQTLRMHIIPDHLRGRSFALLRTLMQGSGPLASAVGGLLLPILGLSAVMALSSVAIGVPGAVGCFVRDLRLAGGREKSGLVSAVSADPPREP